MRRLHHQDARHGTVDHGDASNGVFFLLHLWVLLRVERSFSEDPPPFSSLWMASRCEWLSFMQMVAPPWTYGWRSFGCKKRGAEPTPGVGQAGRPRPILALFSRPFAPMGYHVFMHFSLSTCTILTMSSSHLRWRFSLHEVRSFTLQSLWMFLCNTSVLATIRSSFIKLMNTNKTP
jgi:hypothetical protein